MEQIVGALLGVGIAIIIGVVSIQFIVIRPLRRRTEERIREIEREIEQRRRDWERVRDMPKAVR